MNILVKNLRISKQHITRLGYTASDEQNASLLRKQNSIVIVPEPIITHRPCQFYPQQDANEVVLFQVSGEKVQVSRYPCTNQPFYLDKIRAGLKAQRVGFTESDTQSKQVTKDRNTEDSTRKVKKAWQFWTEQRNRALTLLVAAALFLSLEIALILAQGPETLAVTSGLASYALSIYGAGYVAAIRGHSRLWAFLGILNILGILIVFCFKDRRRENNTVEAEQYTLKEQ